MRSESFEDEVLLYSPESGVGIWLNATASLIWTLCDGERTVGEIVELLGSRYPAAGDLPQHVESTLAELTELGAIDFG